MKRQLAVFGATMLAVAVSTIGFGTAAHAGVAAPRWSVSVNVSGGGAEAVRDALTPELYSDSGGTIAVDLSGCDAVVDTQFGMLSAERSQACPTLPNGTYYLGLDGLDDVPEGMSVSYGCSVETILPPVINSDEVLPVDGANNPEFTLGDNQYAECWIDIRAGVVAIDKIVDGGPADSADFTIDVLDVDGEPVTSGVDPSNELCDDSLADCALVNVNTDEHGWELSLDETPEWGYELDGIECDSFINLDGSYFSQGEFIPNDTDGTFNLGDGDAYCQVTNRYVTGDLVVTAVVVNDNGGTATPADVQFEVFRADTTPHIAATPCLADGSCYSDELAIGDYVMGYIGPEGYTVDITQEITPAAPVDAEIITDDPDAEFTMTEGDLVEIVITIDDPVPATTTTTTTTTLPSTSTTILDGSGVTLPNTGTSGTTNGFMAMLAVVFLAGGGALLAVRRRVG